MIPGAGDRPYRAQIFEIPSKSCVLLHSAVHVPSLRANTIANLGYFSPTAKWSTAPRACLGNAKVIKSSYLEAHSH